VKYINKILNLSDFVEGVMTRIVTLIKAKNKQRTPKQTHMFGTYEHNS